MVKKQMDTQVTHAVG